MSGNKISFTYEICQKLLERYNSRTFQKQNVQDLNHLNIIAKTLAYKPTHSIYKPYKIVKRNLKCMQSIYLSIPFELSLV